MKAQTAMDLIVLDMKDVDAITMVDKQMANFASTGAEDHLKVACMVVKAIDNTYGIGSYAKYKQTGVLPSEQ